MTLYAVTVEMSPASFDVWTQGWEEVRSVWSTRALAEAACVALVDAKQAVAEELHVREWPLDAPTGLPEPVLDYYGA